MKFRAIPGVMRVDAVPELEALTERGDVYARRWYNAIPPDMDAVLAITLEPYHYWRTVSYATHGTPHAYDFQVPIAFLGAPFVKGQYTLTARTVDLAPTLARALGIVPTDPPDGRALVEALVGDLRSGTPTESRRGPASATPTMSPEP
jgi:hypothetical protein